MRFCSTTKSFKKFLYDFIHFPCVLITSHPLKTFRVMVNNKQLLSANNEIVSLDANFDGAVFSTKPSSAGSVLNIGKTFIN